MTTTASFFKGLSIQTWILYSFGLIFVAARTAARRLHLKSFRKFQLDDYIMLFVVVPFTVASVATVQVGKNGSNYSRLSPGNSIVTQEDLEEAILGSKMSFVLEQFLVLTLWLLKACILLMYHRLTLGLWQHTVVKFVAVYCGVAFVVIEILLFAVWCKPFSQYWAVPPTNSQCATYYSHMIVTTVFNISSDLMILLIPLPILVTSIMPIRRKLILCGVFSLGIFVILAAVLNRYYNFTQKYSLIYLNWYVVEQATALYVANAPLLWPVLRYFFSLKSWGSDSSNSGTTDNSTSGLQSSSKRPSIMAMGSSRRARNDTLNDIRGGPSRRVSIQGSNTQLENIDIDLELGDFLNERQGEASNADREGNVGNLEIVEEEISEVSDHHSGKAVQTTRDVAQVTS